MVIIACAVVAFTTVAMTIDLKTRRIPNWLTVPTLGIAVVFHFVVSGLAGLGTVVGGFAVGFGLLFILWLMGGGGGGDVKMMGALGAWLGAPLTLLVFVVSTIIAVMISVYAKIKPATTPAAATAGGKATTAHSAGAKMIIPYAVPVAIATWLVVGAKLAGFSVTF